MKNYIKAIMIANFLWQICFISTSCAATINATTCSQSDVLAAVNSASDGDTVVIPAGSGTWTDGIIINKKGITVSGAGIDKTIITDNTPSEWKKTAFWIIGEEGRPFRITGFTFKGPSSAHGTIKVLGDCKNWRIDHCKFYVHSRSIAAGHTGDPPTYGVIDNCIFISDGGGQGVAVFGDGNAAWERPLTLGTANAVYIEDCMFDWDGIADAALEAYNGARFVFRYNTVLGINVNTHGRDSGGYRSPHSFECYENIIDNSIKQVKVARPFYFRGGTGVVWNNKSYGPMTTKGIAVTNLCTCKEETSCHDPWQECTSYPCPDQIGRSTDSDGDGEQDLEPLYEWNNTYCINSLCDESNEPRDINVSVVRMSGCNPHFPNGPCDHILEFRDFYNDLQRPGYTPYAYPHPLRNEAAAKPPPSSPKGIKIKKDKKPKDGF